MGVLELTCLEKHFGSSELRVLWEKLSLELRASLNASLTVIDHYCPLNDSDVAAIAAALKELQGAEDETERLEVLLFEVAEFYAIKYGQNE